MNDRERHEEPPRANESDARLVAEEHGFAATIEPHVVERGREMLARAASLRGQARWVSGGQVRWEVTPEGVAGTCLVTLENVPTDSDDSVELVALAREGHDVAFAELARALGVPEGDVPTLWQGTRARLRRAGRLASPGAPFRAVVSCPVARYLYSWLSGISDVDPDLLVTLADLVRAGDRDGFDALAGMRGLPADWLVRMWDEARARASPAAEAPGR